MFLWMFLFFRGFQPGCSYKLFSYKKKRCMGISQPQITARKRNLTYFGQNLLYGVDPKKVRAELFICLFAGVYFCFILAPSINND